MAALTALFAVAAIAGCGGGDSENKVSSKAKNDYIAGCTESGQPKEACECIFDELQGEGINTEDEFKKLAEDIQSAAQKPDPASALPQEFRDAANACKDKIKQ